MRVMVFGSSGLFGSSLIPFLKLSGHKILENTLDGGVRVDLTHADKVRAILDKMKPEVIVNLAALTNVDECERAPQLAYMSNVKIVENLTKWIRGNGSHCHLVQISTDQVYDDLGTHIESDITLSNYYGFSKYAGELSAASVPSTILRTNFFGPSKCSGRMSLSDWLVQSINKGNQITVFDDVRFSPLSLQRLIELVEIIVVKRERGIFNVGSKEGMSKADFAFALAEVLELPTKSMTRGTSENVDLIAYRPKNMCMDTSFFEKTFDLQLPTMQEEIESMKGAYAHETR